MSAPARSLEYHRRYNRATAHAAAISPYFANCNVRSFENYLMPPRSQYSQVFAPELENLRSERHRFTYINRSRMNKVFDAYLKRAQAVHAQYGVLERRYLSIDPAKVKQRRDLLYLLLTEPEHWVEAIAREKATRTVRAENTKLYTEAERHARNVRLAEKFDARLSTARHRGRPISIARHTDSFLKSLPSASLFRFCMHGPPDGSRSTINTRSGLPRKFLSPVRLWMTSSDILSRTKVRRSS